MLNLPPENLSFRELATRWRDTMKDRLKDREWDFTDLTRARQMVVLWLPADNCLHKWKTSVILPRGCKAVGEETYSPYQHQAIEGF